MRKISVLILFFLLFSAGFSQSNRTILVENFIQASCNPCAYYNQEMQNFFDTTELSIISLNYHTAFPGEDIMYLQNPEDIDERMEFYNINEIPISVIDGNYFQGGPLNSYFNGVNGWSINDMQERAQENPLISLSVDHNFSEDLESIDIEIEIESFANVSGDLTFYLVIA